MTDVIFSNNQSSGPEKTSKEILSAFKQYFNNLEYKVLVALSNYHTINQEWPTYKELAEFMDTDKNNIQPRLSELREKHAVTTAGKRPCTKSSHNRKVSTFKPVHEEEL